MPNLQQLEIGQISEALRGAQDRHVPVGITCRTDGQWTSFHSRFVSLRDKHVWLEVPVNSEDVPGEFTPAEKIGVTFKLKHHKYLCSATVVGIEQMGLEDGESLPVLSLCYPAKMQRLQRRAFQRAEVPANRIVRASFWPGGREAEPLCPTPEKPVITGRVTDLSAGGLQMRTGPEVRGVVEAGYIVGIRIAFGAGREQTVYADAQFRHAQEDGDEVLVGFQFVGLAQSSEGQSALQLISTRVNEFHRAAEMAASGR